MTTQTILQVDDLLSGEGFDGNLSLIRDALSQRGIEAQLHADGYVEARVQDLPSVSVWLQKPPAGLMLRFRSVVADSGSEVYRMASSQAAGNPASFYGPNQNADFGGAINLNPAWLSIEYRLPCFCGVLASTIADVVTIISSGASVLEARTRKLGKD